MSIGMDGSYEVDFMLKLASGGKSDLPLISLKCPGAGIGRQAGFRNLCSQERGSSSLPQGTSRTWRKVSFSLREK